MGYFVLLIVLLLWGLRYAYRHHKTDWGKTWLNMLDGLNILYCRHFHRLQTQDKIAIPTTGAALVVANHSAGLDSLILVALSRRPLRFLIDYTQYNRPVLRWLFDAIGCIPVNYAHRPEKALRHALRALKAGEVIALYPHGGFWLPGQPKKFKRGVLWLAKRTGCSIYPVHLSGIAGQGTVFNSLFLRSQAEIRYFSAIDANDEVDVMRLQHILDSELDKLSP